MARKRIPDLESVNIEKFAAEGKCIARQDGRVVFIPYTAPGDIVNARVVKKKKNYIEAKVTQFHTLSELRIEPKCEHFGVCGGCKWQHIPYILQAEQKQKQVEEQFEKIGKIKAQEKLPILAATDTFEYRNKVEFSFSHQGWITDPTDESQIKEPALGFHVPGRFDKVLKINTCHLVSDEVNKVLNTTQAFTLEHNMEYYNIREHSGLLRNLIVRTSANDELMVILSITKFTDSIKALFKYLLDACPFITSLNYVINTKKNDTIFDLEVQNFHGTTSMKDKIGPLEYTVRPKSFFQTNRKQVQKLYEAALEMAIFKPTDVVYDLYTGTGSIALYVAHKVKKVVGIEILPQAIEDAKDNAKNNKIDNCHFFVGDMKKAFNPESIAENGVPDIVITDPPRNGMDKEVVAILNEYKPRQVLYISCNPATQARDLALLNEKYQLVKSQAIDMFPQTHHTENIVLLALRN